MNAWASGLTIALATTLAARAGDCPPAVTSAVAKAHAKSKMLSCSRERDDESIVYEVAVRTRDGRQLEMNVTPAGKILITEERISLGDVPPAVLNTLREQYVDAKISESERRTTSVGEVSYELTFTSGGKAREMTLTATGDVMALDDDDAEDSEDDADPGDMDNG